MAVGLGAETWSRLTGSPALVTLEGVRTLHNRNKVKSDKAVRELSATFRPFEQTVRDELDWFRARGYLT